ncbi:hypothetical protein BDN67DRAFT_1065920 [Paxillus ammoniavirescens]|nr:hypothetical protein BDN67DRAFT_1065920 [Paxillus ammoniavirescens]
MRTYFSSLFWISFSLLSLSLLAHALDQGDEAKQDKNFMSFLNPTYVAHKIQEGYRMAPTSLPDAMGNIFSTGTAKGSEPELLQQVFKALRSGDISKVTGSLIASTEPLDITTHSKKIAAHIRSAFNDALIHPASAPGHVERVQSVSESVGQAQKLIIRVGEKYAVKQGVVEPYLAVIGPCVQKLWVLVGDVAEIHPMVIPKLILDLMAMLVPGVAFVKPVVTLSFFGPYVLVSDVLGRWVFKTVWELLKA